MIRSAMAIVGLLASVAIPAVAQAQSETPTVEGYLCQFAGRCPGQTEEVPVETLEVGETAGFRIARASSSADRASPAQPAPVSGPRRQPNPGLVTTPAPPRTPIAGPKADLVISFELNSAQLTAEGRRNAQVFATFMKAPEARSLQFLIAGHTDALGSPQTNMDLSRRRAQAVADLLVNEGVERSRLEVAGYGESRPLNPRSAGDPANRRVEAVKR